MILTYVSLVIYSPLTHTLIYFENGRKFHSKLGPLALSYPACSSHTGSLSWKNMLVFELSQTICLWKTAALLVWNEITEDIVSPPNVSRHCLLAINLSTTRPGITFMQSGQACYGVLRWTMSPQYSLNWQQKLPTFMKNKSFTEMNTLTVLTAITERYGCLYRDNPANRSVQSGQALHSWLPYLYIFILVSL